MGKRPSFSPAGDDAGLFDRRGMLGLMSAALTMPAPLFAAGQGQRPAEAPRLIVDDLRRFRQVQSRIREGTSAGAAIDWYLKSASPGLRAYLSTYSVEPERYLERLKSHPRFYAELAHAEDRLRPYFPGARAAAQRLIQLAPQTPPAPIYLFVGVMGHGATVKEVSPAGGEDSLGVLLPAEHVMVTPATDESEFPDGVGHRAGPAGLAQFTSHELAHVAQVHLQVLERYRSIYREPELGTNLAYAVREGGADFLAFLASGQLRQRHAYYLAHERELWLEFERLLNEPSRSNRGWFSGRDRSRPERPPQLGYGVGWAICREFYMTSRDKEEALRTILSAVEPADFQRILAPYQCRLSGCRA